MKKLLIIAAASTLTVACGGVAETNSNTANTNTNRPAVQQVDAKDLPPGMSTNAITPSANNSSGIPRAGNVNAITNATPPGVGEVKTPIKPGSTPPPGINMDTVRQLQSNRNANTTMPPPGNVNARPRKKVNRTIANNTQ